METTIKFNDDETEKANLCINIDRIMRILETVYDYAYMKNDTELQNIIEDYLYIEED